ncbi:MAG: hypothetical protein OXG37_09105 [Actinomycetia bacterium]|nr:hypothetical protein [Actinomycetes bacterium]
METLLGILELVAWIVAVLLLAVITTLIVIKITPDRSQKDEPDS